MDLKLVMDITKDPSVGIATNERHGSLSSQYIISNKLQ